MNIYDEFLEGKYHLLLYKTTLIEVYNIKVV